MTAYQIGLGVHRAVNDRITITIWIALVLVTATLLIIFAHQWLNAESVYVGMICMIITPIAAHISNYNNRLPPNGRPEA